MKSLRLTVGVIVDAFLRFNADDGWAIASHIALSTLMALFPFLIVVTALAGFIGSTNLADEVARLVVAAWPKEVANPIAKEIHNVLTTARGGVLTVGAFFALYFASSGVESLRIGLNRAYELKEKRSFWLLRLESIGYVLVAAIGLLALAFLVVLGPLVFMGAVRYAPWLDRDRAAFRHRALCRRRPGDRAVAVHPAYAGCRPATGASATSGPASPRRSCCGSPPATSSASICPISPTPTSPTTPASPR